MNTKKLFLAILSVAILLPAAVLIYSPTVSAAFIITDIKITGSMGTTKMTVGQSQQLTATDQNKDNITSTVTWSSSDDSIMSVDDKGVVIAKAIGRATIYAESAAVKRGIIFSITAAPANPVTPANPVNPVTPKTPTNPTNNTTNSTTQQLVNPLGSIDTFGKLLAKIVSTVGTIIASLATIMLIYAGILYLTSAGAPEKITKAKMALIYAIIGIVIGVSATALVEIIKDIVGASQ